MHFSSLNSSTSSSFKSMIPRCADALKFILHYFQLYTSRAEWLR